MGTGLARPIRHGVVRVNRRVLVDDDGEWNALLNSLFWAAWAMKHDVPRLDRAFATLRDSGFDGYRSMTGQAGESWVDRFGDPADVDNIIAMAKKGYDEYGQRAWHVLFADGDDGCPGAARREAIVDALGAKLSGHEHMFIGIEIVNERSNGNKLSVDETRRLTRRLQAQTSVMVIPSCPSSPEDMAELYAGLNAPMGNMHFERRIETGDGGRFEPIQKPFEFPWVPEGVPQPAGYPTACGSGEPIGPQSSGRDERDPMRLALGLACTFIGGCAIYVFHPGAGIRGGGAWDTTDISGQPRRLPEHLDETPQWDIIVRGFAAVRAYLPDGVANWQRWNGHWQWDRRHPFDYVRKDLPGTIHNGAFDVVGWLFKAITVSNGRDIISAVLRLQRPLEPRVHQAMQFDVLEPRGAVLSSHDLPAGGTFKLTPRDGDPEAWNWDGDAFVVKSTLR